MPKLESLSKKLRAQWGSLKSSLRRALINSQGLSLMGWLGHSLGLSLGLSLEDSLGLSIGDLLRAELRHYAKA